MPESAPLNSAPGTHALMGVIARNAAEQLDNCLAVMFSACDDVFFDLASRAKISQDQEAYFSSLREIRQRKATVTTKTTALFLANFAALEQRAARQGGTAQSATPLSAETMELIPESQIERDVLVTDMVSKARLEWQQELFQLHERMLGISPISFEESQNPFDPAQIAVAFVRACDAIEVELPALKLLYKQFDRHVLRNLDEIYLPANQTLLDAGILSNLNPLKRRKTKRYALPGAEARAKPTKSGTVPGSGSGAGGGGGGGGKGAGNGSGSGSGSGTGSGFGSAAGSGAGHGDATSAENGFGIPDSEPEMRELGQLLRRMREGGIRMPMFPQLPTSEGAPQIAREELVALLSDLQTQPVQSESGEMQPVDIRRAIESIAASRGQINLRQADEDIINVVAMFFDIILDDRNLPIEIQALVSRLQIPILKVALKDRSFFSDRRHVARQLINEIARASIGWESSSKDTQDLLYRRLSTLIDEIIHSPLDDLGVFESGLADLRSMAEREESRAAKAEKRTGEKAVAEARIAKARDMVRHVMHERLDGRELPVEITTFLIEDWQQVLQRVHLKHGKDSQEWLEAVQTVDDLVWSVQPHSDEKSRQRLQRLLPDLERRLTNGMEQTQSSADAAQARLDVIRGIQRKLAATDSSQVVRAPISAALKEKITPPVEDQQKSWKEMTAVERQKLQYETLMFEHLKRVDELPIGTWFMYDDLRRNLTRRCKLSARIVDSQDFVFVNRLGVQVYKKPRKAFAYDLQMGHARELEVTPLFDRTIESIASNLRKLAPT